MTAADDPSPASVAATLGGTVTRDYGPRDPVCQLMAAGHRVALRADGWTLDGSSITPDGLAEAAAGLDSPRQLGHALDPTAPAAPCPSCGHPTAAGYRERDYRTGRWAEVRCPPSPCTRCPHPRPRSGPAVQDPAPPQVSPATVPGTAAGPPAGWTVHGHALALAAGALSVDGRQVADDVTPADIVIYARRLYVGGRPVADLAALPEGLNQ